MKHLLQNKKFGLAATVLTGFLLLIIFYGKILFSLNTAFFSLNGDGIQTYFNSSYQVKYDSTLLHSGGMNYPYGEVYIYTQPQILITGPIRFISRYITDISDYTIGIINSLMLISIVLAAVFLYLTLNGIGIPIWISVFASNAIAFISPQIDRMQGHFTLSYVWAIPVLIFLLYQFHNQKATYIYSIFIGLALFILITGHIYFLVFYFAVLIFYWIYRIVTNKPLTFKKLVRSIGQFSIQFILPVLIYLVVVGYFNDTVTERPSKPYGFLVYKACPETVFLPFGMKYGGFLHSLRNFGYIQWEGIAYIGLVGVAGFVIILYGLVRRLFKKEWQRIFEVTDNVYLNILFWSSFLLLFYSFGIPFIWGLEFLVDYIGPLKQLRAIGRFSWLFFYVINIVVLYKLWNWAKNGSRRTSIVWIALILLFADVYSYSKGRQDSMNNRFKAWSDTNNETAENRMIDKLETPEFQAIIPVPSFHMGSEHFNMPQRCNLLTSSCFVSIKTGIPVMAIYSGRASVTQTVRNLAPVMEPYREYEILKDVKNKKDFLIVSSKCSDLTLAESNLIKNSSLIDSTSDIILYRLKYDSLVRLPEKKSEEIRELSENLPLEKDSLYKSIPTAGIVYMHFNDNVHSPGYSDNSAQITGRSYFTLFDGGIENPGVHRYTVSFWMSPIDKDLFPKAKLIVGLYDQEGTVYSYFNDMCGNHTKTFDSTWGLIEYSFELKDPADKIKVTLYNNLIRKNQNYYVDEFIIRPDSCNVMLRGASSVMMNNRWYPLPDFFQDP